MPQRGLQQAKLPSTVAAWRVAGVSIVGVIALLTMGCDRSAAGTTTYARLAEGAARPNIIFIMIDTLRADRLGAYGNNAGLTPVMDGLAAEGVLFEQATAPAPWTLPSIGSLFTSFFPSVHKAYDYRQVEDMDQGRTHTVSVLQHEFETLAEVLRDAGYETAGFVANKFIKREYGFGQGCREFDTSFTGENSVPGKKVNDAACAWLENREPSSKPLFLYLHYMDVHGPYEAAPEFMDPLMAGVESLPLEKRTPLTREQFSRINAYLRKAPGNASDPARFQRLKGYREYWEARYSAGVAEVDHYLAQLRTRLKALGLWDNSYIILTADHGEALGEHGLWEHGYSLYQTDLHVPLVLRWPDVLSGGKRVTQNASLMDLLPTLMDQLRIPIADDAGLQGRSLVGAIAGEVDADRVVYAEAIKTWPRSPRRQEMVRRGDWKLIKELSPARRMRDGSLRAARESYLLFNLAKDPGEFQNVAAANAKVVRQLTDEIVRQNASNAAAKPGTVVRVAPAADLRSLGYTGDYSEDQPESTSKPAKITKP